MLFFILNQNSKGNHYKICQNKRKLRYPSLRIDLSSKHISVKSEGPGLLVRELTFETLPPPPPWGILETYISKNLIPSAVQISLSALISRVRLPWRAN